MADDEHVTDDGHAVVWHTLRRAMKVVRVLRVMRVGDASAEGNEGDEGDECEKNDVSGESGCLCYPERAVA